MMLGLLALGCLLLFIVLLAAWKPKKKGGKAGKKTLLVLLGLFGAGLVVFAVTRQKPEVVALPEDTTETLQIAPKPLTESAFF